MSGGMLVPWARQKIRPSRLQARRPASPAGARSCRRLLESGEQACGWTDAPVRARTRRRFGRVRHHHASWAPPGRAAASSTVTRGPRLRNHGADFCTRSWRGNPNRPMAASLLAFFFLFFLQKGSHPNTPRQRPETAKAPKTKQANGKSPASAAGADPPTRFYPDTLGPRGPRTRRRVRHFPPAAKAALIPPKQTGLGPDGLFKRLSLWTSAVFSFFNPSLSLGEPCDPGTPSRFVSAIR